MERNAMAYYNILSDARDSLRRAIEDNDVRNVEDAQDYIHEIADSHVPVYYNEIFTVMAADGIGMDFEDYGLIEGMKDVISIMQARIYEQLTIDLYGDLGEFIMDYRESLNEEYEEEYDYEEEEDSEE